MREKSRKDETLSFLSSESSEPYKIYELMNNYSPKARKNSDDNTLCDTTKKNEKPFKIFKLI